MKTNSILLLLAISILSFSFYLKEESNSGEGTGVVTIKKSKTGYSLYRDDKPYYVRGAGGYKYYDRLKQLGGNSIRLWSTHNAQEYLDKAHELGLTVTLGLDMGHERRGFNYSDKKAVKAQFEQLKKEVLAYKDHPALLMWGVGNEVDQFAKDFSVWNAVNDLAKFIHEVDKKHPTTTMLAGVPVKHIKEIVKRAPDIDVLSINAFRWIEPVRKDITAAGWTGPYMIGEWGASGYWETDTVPWGAFIEETSTEKARVCAERYEKGIRANDDRCLGSYVFYWGWKQARTHTLLSLFLETGHEIGVQDVLYKQWKGEAPKNSAPEIVPIGIDDQQTHKGIYLKPGTMHMAYTNATDIDKDTLFYHWEIYHESKEKKEGGDTEEKPAALWELIANRKTAKQCSFKAPEKEGAYRIFVTVYDSYNHAATANAPFYVKK